MQHFDSDYMEGAHPKILETLANINMDKNTGYGMDSYCERAKEKIKLACGRDDIDIYFLVGGTQTNATVIDTFLRSYQGVVAADTGHIAVHEAGAIEHSGHKVITLPGENGKLSAKTLDCYMNRIRTDGTYEHMVDPGMVYISYPTEYGTLYTKKELRDLSKVCRTYQIPLYLDGARLGYGLASLACDITLKDLTELCDAFYIGGTKVGALFGEAVVIGNKMAFGHFFTIIKQHGALLAKGWLLGVQFDTLFTDDLYFKISRHAIEMAEKLKHGILAKGYSLLLDSPTNQQFVILENEKMQELADKVTFSVWEPCDSTHTAVRFATSWATREEDIETLLEIL